MKHAGMRLILSLAGIAAVARAATTFDIYYFIDVEGGQSTLVVSPSGQSPLIDTAFAGNGGRDANRIAAAAKAAGGVRRIDTLLITHHHPDHVGGFAELLERLPVAKFLDHGPSVEDGKYPEAYEKAFLRGQYRGIQAGSISVKELDVRVLFASIPVKRCCRS